MGGWVAILSIVVVFLSAWNFELNSQLRAHSDRFDKLKDDSVGYVPVVDDTDNTAYTVPEYWQGAVDKAVKKIDKYTAEAGRDCTVFAWFSDTHYMEGGKNYATCAITAAVMDSCNIPFAILSGDVLTQSGVESALINQLLRCGTSVGANIHEAQYAQGNKDFISKFEIALKECNESEYWLELLYETNSLSETEFKIFQKECIELRRMLVSSVTTLKNK